MTENDEGGQFDKPTPAQRLRALELSGDPDAVAIAHRYRESPLRGGVQSTVRDIQRSQARLTDVFRPTYALANEADAQEAEEEFARVRAAREDERRRREEELQALARAGDRREATMLRLTWASIVIAAVSLVASTAAVIIALSSG